MWMWTRDVDALHDRISDLQRQIDREGERSLNRLDSLEAARHSLATLDGEHRATCAALQFAQNSFDWMKVQYAQVTFERNQLLETVTKGEVPARQLNITDTGTSATPGIPPSHSPVDSFLGVSNPFQPGLASEDMGDEEAARQGIETVDATESLSGAVADGKAQAEVAKKIRERAALSRD